MIFRSIKVALSKYDSTLGSAVIVERYQYSPFGITTIYNADKTQEFDESQYGNPYMFTGRRYDSETGLYYYRRRNETTSGVVSLQ